MSEANDMYLRRWHKGAYDRFSFLREAGTWLVTVSVLCNIATFAFLWWLVITAIRSPQPAFVLPPVGESTITYPAWGKDGYHIVTKPVKP